MKRVFSKGFTFSTRMPKVVIVSVRVLYAMSPTLKWA